MDEDQGQNIDGIKNSDSQAPVSGVDGFVVSPKTQAPVEDNSTTPEEIDVPPVQQENVSEPVQEEVKPKKQSSGKGLKVWLAIFIVLFVLSTSALAFFFYQASQYKSDLDSTQQKNAALTKQASEQKDATSQEQINQLNAQIKTMQSTIDSQQTNINTQKTYIDSLTKVAQQLKTTCGTACNSITIPPAPSAAAPTSTTPTTTPTR
jgi:uncharacterized protein HemX